MDSTSALSQWLRHIVSDKQTAPVAAGTAPAAGGDGLPGAGPRGVLPAIERVSSCRLPTRHGLFTLHGYREAGCGREHLALSLGDPAGEAVLARLHSECLTGESFGSLRCDCQAQLEMAMARVAREGRGIIVYLRGHEGRGIGLLEKLRAYALQDDGADTVEANLRLGLPVDGRDYGVGVAMLRDLGVRSVRLMTNNPRKVEQVLGAGLPVSGRVPLVTAVHEENSAYLRTKQAMLGHQLFDGGRDAESTLLVGSATPAR